MLGGVRPASDEISSVAIGAKTDQIASVALRTFDAMTNASHATSGVACALPSAASRRAVFKKSDEAAEIRDETTTASNERISCEVRCGRFTARELSGIRYAL